MIFELFQHLVISLVVALTENQLCKKLADFETRELDVQLCKLIPGFSGLRH